MTVLICPDKEVPSTVTLCIDGLIISNGIFLLALTLFPPVAFDLLRNSLGNEVPTDLSALSLTPIVPNFSTHNW